MKLYVNDFSNDKAFGMTDDQRLIDYNLGLLPDISSLRTQVFVLGRYFSLLVINKKDINRRMLFFDLRKDLTIVSDIVNGLHYKPALQRKFITMMELYNLQYESNYETVELSTGSPADTIGISGS